jgi:ABC-2 type transport system permease protein
MLYEMSLIFRQSLKSTWRSPIWMVIMLFEPVCLLLLFAPLLDKLVGMPGFDNGTGSALAIFAPGLLVMLAIFGTAYSGFGVLYALRSGGVERLRVTGISPFALALGYALANVITLLLQAAIVMGIALLMGMRINLLGTVIVLLLVALMGVGISACSYAFALTI